ncbi:hypothetical protein F7230_06260 [Corynebacterium sp. 320]|uniref:alpha/beta hydrolase n=1 Tax=Corynebacterium TaxID=1716 RepID=UPI00125CBF57|nr:MULTISPECIES: alpha/beta hydrolase [Corynebacterium]KAB1503133.1 hypothetical protein F7230_06260 [Corynebacterium sp. 320]KAB1550653.1 hypothetical protein F7233_08925 [Corynebacterium sp. 321]KAB1551015.1 hypothetical protein F7232_08105 [Corynebacterium sp. 319]KAB3526930.1 hypothetical protein F8354_06260 [Corynebacterium sp. 250]KAB3538423.1 hypothetical protein F8390_09160 [Corynebacterium sp. 366]
MISIFDIETAPTQEFSGSADTLKQVGSTTRACAQDVRTTATWQGGAAWSGDAADAASHRTQSTANRTDSLGLATSAAGGVTSIFSAALKGFQEGAATTLELARGLGFEVSAHGDVTPSTWQLATATAASAIPGGEGIAAAMWEMAAVLSMILKGIVVATAASDVAASTALAGLSSAQASAREPEANKVPSPAAGPAPVSRIDTPTGPVVTVGNVESADRIITLVSGVGSSAESMVRQKTIWAEQQVREAAGRGEKLAVVAWHGYQAPKNLPEGFSQLPAKKAGPALREFQKGLRQKNPHAQLKVMGHSYGSVVVGEAARDKSFQADDIHLMGSPGTHIPPSVPHTAQRQLGDNIWATEGASALVPPLWKGLLGHGPDPVPRSASDAWDKLMTGYLWMRGENNAHSSYLWDGKP